MILNFKEAFTFMFKDEKFWQKYIIGTLFAALVTVPNWIIYPKLINKTISPLTSMGISLLTIILGMFVYGFMALYANSKITLKQDILPEWSSKDIGNIALAGIKYILGLFVFGVAAIIALLPVIIILSIIAVIIMGIIMAPSIASLGPNANPSNPAYATMIAGYALIGALIFLILFLPVFIVLGTTVYLSVTSFFTDLKFGSFFNLKRMWSYLRGNVLNLIILAFFFIVYTIFIQIILKIAGYHLYFGLLLIFNFYISLVFTNLYAQYALIGIQKNTERLEEKKTQEHIETSNTEQ